MARLQTQDEELARACDLANRNEDILLIEREFDAISQRYRRILEQCPGAVKSGGLRLDPIVGSEIGRTRPCLILSTPSTPRHIQLRPCSSR